jgi:hypothetical protein
MYPFASLHLREKDPFPRPRGWRHVAARQEPRHPIGVEVCPPPLIFPSAGKALLTPVYGGRGQKVRYFNVYLICLYVFFRRIAVLLTMH